MRESKLIASWVEEGIKETHRKYILRALQLRLTNPLPVDLVNAVNASDDLHELERWFDLSQTANTLAEFRGQAEI